MKPRSLILIAFAQLHLLCGQPIGVGPHPKLFFSMEDVPTLRVRADSTAWLKAVRMGILQHAEEYIATPTAPYPLLADGAGISGRALQQRVGLLAFAGYLSGEQRYFEKGVEILLAVARQSDPRDRSKWKGQLQYCDAAQAFAIGYDWLAPYLKPSEVSEVEAELEAFGELLFTDKTAWGAADPGVSSCNRNAVQFGALGLCALVLGGHESWLNRATTRIQDYLRFFADSTGYVTEGHDYQAYGLLGAMPFATALLRIRGKDLMAEHPNFQLTSDQILWKLLPFEGRMLAMNDNDEIAASAAVTYPMLRYRQPVHLWAWWESQRATTSGIGTLREGLSAPFLFIWGDSALEPIAPADAFWPLGHRFESGRVFLRSSWRDPDAAHVSFTCGYDFHRGHNHQDENAITLYALGEGFLIDPGYQPSGSRSHNTLRSIDGAVQAADSSGRIVTYEDYGDYAYMRGQAPEAYQWPKLDLVESGLVGNFDRKVLFRRGPQPYLAWRDDAQVENDDPSAEYVAQFVTYPQNAIEMRRDGFIITGHRSGAKCRVWVLSGTSDVLITEEDLSGERFATRGREYRYGDFYKGVIAAARALNPQFVVLAFPYKSDLELPTIRLVTVDDDQLMLEVMFNDGGSDRLFFASTGAKVVEKGRSDLKRRGG